jgi:hypothetical protein
MGGAEATAPPIFFSGDKFKKIQGNLGAETAVYCKSPGLMEDFREETLPYRALVGLSDALHPARDPLSSPRLRRRGPHNCFTSRKQEPIQEETVQEETIHDGEAKDLEGPSRQTQSKARLAPISCPGNANLPLGGLHHANREIGVPRAKTETGNLAVPRFSAFYVRRRGAYWRLGRYAPRARCDRSCLCSKPGGVKLTSVANRTTIPFYAYVVPLARVPSQFPRFGDSRGPIPRKLTIINKIWREKNGWLT